MDIPGILSLISQQNSDLVNAVNALPPLAVSPDPLQAQLDAANQALNAANAQLASVQEALQAETAKDQSDAALAAALQTKIANALAALN